MKDEKWTKVGQIGVDAGLCWVGDPCYIIHPHNGTPKDLGKDWSEFCDRLERGEKHQGKAQKGAVQFNYDMGHAGLGVAVNTGFGDGVYDVFVRYSNEGSWGRRVAELKVVFIGDDETE